MKNIQVKKLFLPGAIFVLTILIVVNAYAQTSTEIIETFTTQSHVKRTKKSAETIKARKASIATKLNLSIPTNSSEIISLPQLNYEKIIKEDNQNQGYKKELRVGVHRTIEQSFDQNWRIFSRTDGKYSWRVVIYSPGAGSIRPHFKRFPSAGSEVYLYGKGGVDTLEGPVKKPDVYEGDEFWGPVIKGDYLYIEVGHDSASEHPDLYIDTISHRYRDPISGTVNDSILRDSKHSTDPASCELDIKCYSSWVPYGKGVARMLFEENGQSAVCTGALVMDQSSTFRNWFLTANHCISSNTVANTLIAYFDYTTIYCNWGEDWAWEDFEIIGATFKNGNAKSDFSLLELSGKSLYDDYDVSYLGWTSSNISSGASVTGIHHPRGSYQRISFGKGYDDSSDFTSTGILYKGEDFWDILWTSGTTEKGSSGSPLLNSTGQIVGQLLAGAPAYTCTNTDIAIYGKFSVSWNSGLKNYLSATCTYTITPTSQTFISTGGSGSITVTPSSSSCTWTATESLSWVSITSGSSGTGSGTVSYSVSANTSTSSRSGNMTIAGQTFTITQSAHTCSYTISPTSKSFTSSGGTGSVTVTPSSSSCTWTATESLDWVTITSGSSGTGSGAVNYSVSANTSTSSRSGNMTIAGQTFTITQSAHSCTYTISPTSKSFTSSSGTDSVTVTPSSSSCTWTASESLDWVSITSGSSGTGSGTVNYSVSANTSTSSRSGNMTIAGQTFTITQSAHTCSYTISPTSKSFTSSGGTGSVTVTPSSSSCTWTATESLDWVTITSGSSGTGSGAVNYSVSANTSTSSRSGNMTIAGQTFTITQSAHSCTYTISPTSKSFTSSGGTGSVTVSPSSSSCTWTATESLDWVSITSGSSGTGSGTVNYSVSANTSTSSRSGNMTIAGQTFTITQTGAAQNNCAATVSSSLVVHIPVITYSGSNYWADLAYNSGNGTLSLTNAGVVNDSTPYSSCTASTLSSDYKLHIPVLMLDGVSYWADLQYNGTVFVISGGGQN